MLWRSHKEEEEEELNCLEDGRSHFGAILHQQHIQSPWETLSCLRGQVEKGLDNFFALITFKNHFLKLI